MNKFLLAFCLTLTALWATVPGFAQDAMPAAEASQMVDINTADANTLASSLSGIGMARAAAIVRYRKEHGPFASVDDLVEVSGIGPSILAKNRDVLTASQ